MHTLSMRISSSRACSVQASVPDPYAKHGLKALFKFGIFTLKLSIRMCRWFRFAQLAKGKSLGRSKPETNSYEQALATHCVGFLLYPSSAELPYAK